jgi:hypothetical protein
MPPANITTLHADALFTRGRSGSAHRNKTTQRTAFRQFASNRGIEPSKMSVIANRAMHSSTLVCDRKFGQMLIITERPALMRKRSCQDKAIRGNSFVPSYLRPLRNIPYMAWSNFLATAMSACRRALFRTRRLSKRLFAWGSQRDATSAGM